MDYGDELFLPSNNRYILSFDVKAEQLQSSMLLFVVPQFNANPFVLIREDFEVPTFFESKTMILQPINESLREVRLVINYGSGTNNTYCFDNIVKRISLIGIAEKSAHPVRRSQAAKVQRLLSRSECCINSAVLHRHRGCLPGTQSNDLVGV